MSLKSILLVIPIFIKNFFDLILGVNQISSSATLVFLAFGIRIIFFNRFYILSLLLLLPLVLIDPLALRILITITVLFVFISLFKYKENYISNSLQWLIMLLAVAIILGLMFPNCYVNEKYKFIYNDPNNFGPYAVSYISILMYTFFQALNQKYKYFLIALIAGIYISILAIKGRLYGSVVELEMAFFIWMLIKDKNTPKITTNLFIILLLTGTLVWIQSIGINLLGFITNSTSELITQEAISTTGRTALWYAFIENLNSYPFHDLVYGSIYKTYVPLAESATFHSTTHSYVENSYLAIFLFGGLIPTLFILTLLAYVLILLIKQKVYLTFIIAGWFYVIFFFDDSLVYPISVYHQMLTVYVFFQMEKLFATYNHRSNN